MTPASTSRSRLSKGTPPRRDLPLEEGRLRRPWGLAVLRVLQSSVRVRGPLALRESFGSIDDDLMEVEVDTRLCSGMVIIHLGRIVTCSDPMCDAASGGMGVMLDRHCWFVSCTTTPGSQCPVCRSSHSSSGHPGSATVPPRR